MSMLVTGAAGHLGEAIMRTLRDSGESVMGTDIKTGPFVDRVGDLTDPHFARACVTGRQSIFHTAALHKPHVVTHSKRDFITTNVLGTLNLLESAVESATKAFVFTSTTSVFGAAIQPSEAAGKAVWVDEQLQPVPKNIYGVTKRSAEDLCELFYLRHGLNAVVLRTSRFFPEQGDSAERRDAFADENLKANELLFRRADLADMVSAHVQAAKRAPILGFDRLIVSAPSPFQRSDLEALLHDAPAVVARYVPSFQQLYDQRGWTMFPAIGRVYDSLKARERLNWQPVYDFHHVLRCLRAGEPISSPLARAVGAKGYHNRKFHGQPFPVDETAQSQDGNKLG